MTFPEAPSIPVSWGELLDKLTILAIKRERIADAEAHANVVREYEALAEVGAKVLHQNDIPALIEELRTVNQALWEIEDAIRVEESRQRFGPEFIALARSVYRRNDERAAIKRRINLALGSALIEEKSYAATSANGEQDSVGDPAAGCDEAELVRAGDGQQL